MSNELKESMTAMSHQIKNSNKNTETIKENQVEILEQKSPITDTKNSLGHNTRFELTEERIGQLEDKSTIY